MIEIIYWMLSVLVTFPLTHVFLKKGMVLDYNISDETYLDLNKFSWSMIAPVSKNKPLGRLFHASVVLNSNKLLVHGGWNGDDVYADGWCFDLYLLSWER